MEFKSIQTKLQALRDHKDYAEIPAPEFRKAVFLALDEVAKIGIDEIDAAQMRDAEHLSPEAIRSEDFLDRQRVRNMWGDTLKSMVITANLIAWTIIIGLLFVDLNGMANESSYTRIINTNVVVSMIGATVVQAAALAAVVVKFGFEESKKAG